jgi:hypothetical protein
MLIIGSTARHNQGIDIGRKPRDLDLIMSLEELEKFKKSRPWTSYKPTGGSKWLFLGGQEHTEVEVAWPGSSAAMLLDWYKDEGTANIIPEHALLLKLSHRYRKNSPHFHKTMKDIHLLREELTIDGCDPKWDEDELAILKLREEETYTYTHPKLNKSKNEFFTDRYLFDHDSIHEAVAIGVAPAYHEFSMGKVMCDMNLFEAARFDQKLAAVYEETCVLALERSVIPHGTDQHVAFLKALEKVCTSITSGRFREFAWENYHNVVRFKRDATPYIKSFYEGIANGVVKPELRK